ncbi:MAG TPA: TolC family protein [Rubrivivax sp.]|nr:TolC family protein [Rubrivivax sp.]
MDFSLTRMRAAVYLLLGLPLLASAGLSFDEAARLARDQAPALQAQRSALDGAQALLPAAATLPDPRLIVGLDNLPVTGADRFSTSADFMTMQRIGVMQEVPNAAKREARAAGAQARIERERAVLAAAELTVRRDAALAWLAVYFAEDRAAQLTSLERENRLLQDTLDARIASGKALPAERTMARIDALMVADRRDDALRDVERARASLRRWVGARAAEPLEGGPPPLQVSAERLRADLHRHAEIAPYDAMQAMARAEAREADAEQRGDWGWEVVYSRRPQYGDMMSFQLVFDLPWDRERRQQPQLTAKLREAARIEAERADTMRRHAEEIDGQLAELKALDAQHTRLERQALALNAERVALALASYQAGRGDLGAVLVARREAVETRLRLIDLDAQRAALRVRLNNLIAE